MASKNGVEMWSTIKIFNLTNLSLDLEILSKFFSLNKFSQSFFAKKRSYGDNLNMKKFFIFIFNLL
jgi:hypothetical protein